MRAGVLESVQIGACRRVPRNALVQYVESLRWRRRIRPCEMPACPNIRGVDVHQTSAVAVTPCVDSTLTT